MSPFKYGILTILTIMLVWFAIAQIKACNRNRDLAEINKPFVENEKRLKDSLYVLKRKEDSLSRVSEAFRKSADSTVAIKNHVEEILFASNNRAEQLAAENKRLKTKKDTVAQLENCDELAEEVTKTSIALAEYKSKYDNVVSLKDSVIATEQAKTATVTNARNKLDSAYRSLYVYNQSTFAQLQKTTKKANKTVTISIGAGYGVPLSGVIKPQPIAGITISKTLLRLW